MLSFSKAISTGKTAQEALADAKKEEIQQRAMQILAQKKLKEQEELANQVSEAELQEQAEHQKIVDKTERKMLAAKYVKMEIEDEKKEGLDGGVGNFKVIADQKAEQDYAINTFKGSGEMSETFDTISKQSEKEKKDKEIEEAARALIAKKKAEATPNAEKGEALISDQDSIWAYSAQAATDAGATGVIGTS